MNGISRIAERQADMAEVIYCYRCGKHVKRDGGKCWYCNTPTRRVIRPPRHCPFCDEEIGAKAVKCPHCGEFLDGRPKVESMQASQPPVQIFYMIDKALIQGDKPLMIQGGQAIPPEVAGVLSHQTIQAIRSNNPSLVDQAGVRALPAPVLDAQVLDVTDESCKSLPLSESRETSSARKTYDAPVRHIHSQDGEDAHSQTLSGQITRALVRGAGFALSKAGSMALGSLKREDPEPIDAQVISETDQDPYRICKFCNTEVLKTDAYCFHCGVQLSGEPQVKLDDKLFQEKKSNAGIFILVLLMLGSLIFLRTSSFRPELMPGGKYLVPSITGLCPVLLVSAFFRRRTFVNQFLVLVLFVLWIGTAIWTFA